VIGVGAMFCQLGGNAESVDVFTGAIGRRISTLELSDDALSFTFDDGYRMDLYDAAQSCCEARYLRTDDDLAYYIGAVLVSAEVSESEETTDDLQTHEIAFLRVATDRGVITIASHNEHNGYYGGISICARVPR